MYRVKHNWKSAFEMLQMGLECIKWLNKEELIFLIQDKDEFVKAWYSYTGKKMSYANITRGFRYKF